MNLTFSIAAEKEIQTAADYYESKEAGLGFHFIDELNHAIAFVLQFPNAWSLISKRSRRCVLGRFPYNILYSVEQDTVTIVTVVHQRRDPEKWQTLIKDLRL
jgi:plasmid stabilization system protein ParE